MTVSKTQFNNTQLAHSVSQWCTRLSISRAMLLVTLAASASAHADVEIVKIGNPIFEPSEIAYGVATKDRTPRNTEELFQFNSEWESAAFGDTHVLAADADRHVLLPGKPHLGPYDQEVRRAYAGHGLIQTDVLTVSEMRGRKWFAFGFAMIPTEDAPLGNSPDGESVPVIPDEVYPFQKTTFRSHNGESPPGVAAHPDGLDSIASEGVIVDENGVERNFTGLEASHHIFGSGVGGLSGTSSARLRGDWEVRQQILDASGENGWDVITRWKVVDRASRIVGDLSHNGILDMHDLNIMTQNVAVDATNLKLDLNDDELVNVEDVHHWVRDLKDTWIGDANLDGEFNSGDFVAVFGAGKYGTDELARWNEGDWNADERFDSSDFVVAFQDGGYEMGKRAPVAVPEPSCVGLAALGLAAILRCRKS